MKLHPRVSQRTQPPLIARPTPNRISRLSTFSPAQPGQAVTRVGPSELEK